MEKRKSKFMRIVVEEYTKQEPYTEYVEFKIWEDGDVAVCSKDHNITIRNIDFENFIKRREEMLKQK